MHNEKILVVEDEGIVAEDIKNSLRRLGYEVPAIATSGEEAIRKSEEFNPDLVLMDIVLQGEIDGIEAAKKICTDFNIPVVYLTAYADEEMLERAKITEPIGYILKPYNEKELHATIEMAIYQYKTGRRRREIELTQILESAPDCVVITDSNGQITRINAQTEKIFGYDRGELFGKTIEILIPERFREVHIRHRRDYYSSPRMRPIGTGLDLYGLRKDGSEFPVDICLSPIEIGRGLSVIAIIRDITERKEAEKALKESEQKFRVLIEKSYDGVMLVDVNGLIKYASPGVTRILGYTSSEFVSRNAFDIMHPNDLQDTQNLFSYLIQNPTEVVTSQFRYRHKDGSWRWLEGTGTNLLAEPTVQAIVDNFRDITERKQAEEQIHHLAYYDLLTDLPNRLSFRDSIDRAITSAKTENRAFALLIVNLNRFKEINDTLGHQNGDIILKQIGERLQNALQEAGTIARIGGDEFAVLMSNADLGGATQIADKILERLEEPFAIEGLSLNISASIGIAIFPGHGEDADTLFRRGDIAMHEAKKTESGYTTYSYEYDQYSPERLALIGELRHAINSNQLFLLYQPKIDLRTGRTIGVESLCRWQHPRAGIIPPDQFISLAEKSGLIRQLTFWVIKEALRQSRGWHQAGIEVSVAVNLSVRNLQAPQLLDQIKGLLSTWGVASTLLRFEITESIIMADPELALGIITQLTLMGIRFSIDDFGTGYSSLKYLQRLPVDEIKIDKSFVMNMMIDENSMKIVRSTIELAHSLELKVTAEGVETKEIMERLASLGCDAAQGYFISRPVSQEDLMAWLSKKSTGS